MPAPPGHRADRADGPVGIRDQRVDQGGLAHPGVTDEHADPAVEGLAQRGEPCRVQRAAEHHVADAQRRVGVQQVIGAGQVGLGQAEQRA